MPGELSPAQEGDVSMSGVFSHDYSAFPFMFFSAPHIAMIVLSAAAAVLLFIFRKVLYRYDPQFRLYMFMLLFTLELFYHLWLYHGGKWDISFTLPLQLCSISLVLSLLLLGRLPNCLLHRRHGGINGHSDSRAFFRLSSFSIFSIFYYS